MENSRLNREQNFHDEWAVGIDKLPDPRRVNEACTSPELRYINSIISPVEGKKIMDLGCGLGEVSVYFAIHGAKVTSVDLSLEMLNATKRLAEKNNVTIKTHQAAAEGLGLEVHEKFDIIYVGNLFHHVNINETLDNLIPHINEDGVLVSWDPLHYNPIIRIYRLFATNVRTEDERPFKKKDIIDIGSRFEESKVRFFWLTTLIIFIIMAIKFNNPSRVRYWKKVVDDEQKWSFLHKPLEKIDRMLMKIFPVLKWMCWNVVIVAKRPKMNV